MRKKNNIKSPDFICIGAQKAGTTWLHRNLKLHPQSNMPPEKEVNFFYYNIPPKLKRMYYKWFYNWITPKDDSKQWINWWVCRYITWRDAKRSNNNFPIEWFTQNIFADRTIENYIKLFPKQDGKVSGDISPIYAFTPEEQIKKLALKLPNTKIIYLLRNPIERAWSAFRFEDNGKHLDNTDAEILLKIQSDPGLINHGSYCYWLDIWEKYFPVKVWFYDELCENPEKLFLEVCEYLGIIPTTCFEENRINERINHSRTWQIPKNVQQWLSEQFRETIIKLHGRFNNRYTQNWLESQYKILYD